MHPSDLGSWELRARVRYYRLHQVQGLDEVMKGHLGEMMDRFEECQYLVLSQIDLIVGKESL